MRKAAWAVVGSTICGWASPGRASRASYMVIQEGCTPFARDRPAAPFETAVWALTHGFAALNMDQPYPSDTPVNLSSYEDALRLLVG